MYRDLDPESWPAENRLEDRPLVRALMQDGFPPVAPLCNEEDNIDSLFDPAQTSHVIDCDSSQSLVIEEACRGRSLVIQGPPGTGKSQTITNLIASAVKSGKTILFVAEKMAALEVVKRRLDNIGIGDMCLELHSKKANKRAVLQEIDRTLKLGTPVLPKDLSDTVKALKKRRDQLNAHVQSLHTPQQPTGKSPYQVLSELIDLRADDVSLPDFQITEASRWSPDQYDENLASVKDLAGVMDALGSPSEHPWRGSQLDQILPLDLERLLVAAPKQVEQLDAMTEATRNLASRLGDDPPTTLAEVGLLLRTSTALLKAPELDAQPMGGTIWTDHREAIKEMADSARAILKAKAELKDKVVDAAWDTDVAAARQAYAMYGQSFFRMFRSSYRRARRTLRSLLTSSQPATFEERVGILNLLDARRKAIKDLGESDSLGEKAFGRFWLGNKTDWKRLVAWEQWDAETRAADTSPRFRQMLSLLDDPDQIQLGAGDAADKLDKFLTGFKTLCEALKISYPIAFGDETPGSATVKAVTEGTWQSTKTTSKATLQQRDRLPSGCQGLHLPM